MRKKKINWNEIPFCVWSDIVFYKEDDNGNQKFYKPNDDFSYSYIAESINETDVHEFNIKGVHEIKKSEVKDER